MPPASGGADKMRAYGIAGETPAPPIPGYCSRLWLQTFNVYGHGGP
jgi:hypothetical protein